MHCNALTAMTFDPTYNKYTLFYSRIGHNHVNVPCVIVASGDRKKGSCSRWNMDSMYLITLQGLVLQFYVVKGQRAGPWCQRFSVVDTLKPLQSDLR